MTPARALAVVLSISCAFFLGRELARRDVPREPPGPAYDVQIALAARAGHLLSETPAKDGPSFVEVADKLRPSVVSILARGDTGISRGTGVIVSSDGAVLTNNHVISGMTAITVTLSSSDWYAATIVGQDEPTDLALVRIEGVKGLFPASFGDSDALRVAEDVLVIGNAFGLGWTVTRGIISSLHRNQIVGETNDPRWRGPAPYTDYIQTDAAINLGNSGGPIVNAKGEVVGISTAIIQSRAQNDEGLGYATGIGFGIPSSDARFVANELLKNGKVRRGYLGINGKDLSDLTNDIRRRAAPASGTGTRVTTVHANTPAERAGLLIDDVIVALDGAPLESFSVLRNRVARIAPQTEIALRVVREGVEREIRAVVGDYPVDR